MSDVLCTYGPHQHGTQFPASCIDRCVLFVRAHINSERGCPLREVRKVRITRHRQLTGIVSPRHAKLADRFQESIPDLGSVVVNGDTVRFYGRETVIECVAS